MNENEWIDVNKLKFRNCNEWIGMNDLTWMNWNEMKLRNWKEGIDMNELKWRNDVVGMMMILLMSSSKSTPRATTFYDLYVKSALAEVLHAFCWRLSPIEQRDRGNRDPPSATMAATFPEKKTQGFALENVSKLNSRVPDLSHFSTTWWQCACFDDKVDMMMIDMMMWLRW